MRDIVVDIAEPVFVFTVVDLPRTFSVDAEAQSQFASIKSVDVVMEPNVSVVMDAQEIMMVRAAAEAMLNDSR